MDNKTESSNLSYISQQSDKQILSKLRRLKIQEAVFTQNLLKTEEKSNYGDSQSQNNFPTSELKGSNDAVQKIKDSYRTVKNLFDEIYTHTHSRELLADIDIKEMKDKVLEFETKLKSLKFALIIELKSLKSSEQELIHQLHEQPKETNKIKQQRKVSSAKYNDIIPSPVRTLMMSPFKCTEVQEFQDFMKNSGNRYGGWNEYNHNVFVKSWLKGFGPDCNIETITDNDFLVSEEYTIFIHDLLPKLQGINENDIKSHTKWYTKYLFLKNKQQEAIERWKWSKRSVRDNNKEVGRVEEVKVRTNNDAENNMSSGNNFAKTYKNNKERNVSSHFMARKKHITKQDEKESSFSTLMKPTSQSINQSINQSFYLQIKVFTGVMLQNLRVLFI